MTDHGYARILRRRGMVGLLAAGMIGGLASGMVPFGAVALFTTRAQPAYAGAAFAVFLVCAAVTGPWRGRLVDSYGAGRVLPTLAVLFGTLVCIAAVTASVPALSLAALAGSAFLVPPGGATLRTVWTTISATPEENRALHSLDSVLEEATFVVSPLLTSLLWAALSPAWALAAGALTAVAGTALLLGAAVRAGERVWQVFGPSGASASTGEPGPASGSVSTAETAEPSGRGRGRSLFLDRNGVALLAPMLGLGVVMGCVGVAVPTWAMRSQAHAAEISGIVLSVISAAGVVAGLVFGKRRQTWSRRVQYVVAGVLPAAGAAVLAANTTLAGGLAAAVVIGLGMTPMFIIGYLYVSDTIPAHRHTEANAALGSTYNLGSGGAAAATGALASVASASLPLAAAATVAALLSLAALLSRPLPSTSAVPAQECSAPSPS